MRLQKSNLGFVILLLAGVGLLLSGCRPEDSARKEALADSYAETYGAQVFWAGEEPDQPQAGDIRLESMELLGEAQVGEVSGAVYLVAASVFVMETEDSRWVAMEPCAEVILWSGTGEGAQVLTPPFLTQGLEPEQIIRQTLLNEIDTQKKPLRNFLSGFWYV